MNWFLTDEATHPRRGCGSDLGGFLNAIGIVAHGIRRLGVMPQQVSGRHDRIERVVHIMHHTGGQLTDRCEATLALPILLRRKQRPCTRFHQTFEMLTLVRDLLLPLGLATVAFRQLASELFAIRHVAIEQHDARDFLFVIADRRGKRLDPTRRSHPAHFQQLPSYLVASERPHCG